MMNRLIVSQIKRELMRLAGAPRSEAKGSSVLSVLALVVSVLGFCVSIGTFYLTRVQKPVLMVTTPNYMGIKDTTDDYVGIYLTVAFSNDTERGAVVTKSALAIRQSGMSKYFMLAWEGFFNHGPQESIEFASPAAPIAIGPRSAERRLVRYLWNREVEREFLRGGGKYELYLLVWTSDVEHPQIVKKLLFDLPQGIADAIRRERLLGNIRMKWVYFEDRVSESQILDETQVRPLLNHPNGRP